MSTAVVIFVCVYSRGNADVTSQQVRLSDVALTSLDITGTYGSPFRRARNLQKHNRNSSLTAKPQVITQTPPHASQFQGLSESRMKIAFLQCCDVVG